MESENNYYDHYKDTWSVQQSYLSERNKLTVTLLVLLVFVAGFIYDPAMLNEKINTYVASHVESLAFEMKYLNTGLIFLLLWIMTRYYQAVIKIERMYRYLKNCENNLSADNKYVIDREGAYYSKSKPWFTRVIDFCYVVLLPLAIIVIAVVKIVNECAWTTDFKVVDFIGLGLIILLSLLYIINRWFKKKKKNKKEEDKDKKE